MTEMVFGKGRNGARVRRETVASAPAIEGPVVVQIPASICRAIDRLRGDLRPIETDGGRSIRSATFAEAVTSVLEQPW